MKKISIIVPVYNVEPYLNQCLESLHNQTLQDIEIIIVDDGSTDGCPAIIDEWRNRDKRMKIIHKENGGVSSARNEGIEIASADWIAFVDPDDWCDIDYYENLYNVIQNQEEVIDAVICDYNEFIDGRIYRRDGAKKDFLLEEDNKIRGFRNRIIVPNIQTDDNICLKYGMAQPWNKLYKKSIIDKQNLRFNINLRYYDDVEFNFHYFHFTKSIYYIKVCGYFYRLNNDSFSRKFKSDRIELDKAYLESLIQKSKEENYDDDTRQAIYISILRVIIHELLVCYYLHDENKLSVKNKIEILKSEIDYFQDEISKIKPKNLKISNKIVLMLIKNRYLMLLLFIGKVRKFLINISRRHF